MLLAEVPGEQPGLFFNLAPAHFVPLWARNGNLFGLIPPVTAPIFGKLG